MATKTKAKKQIEWPQRLDDAILREFEIKTETFFDLIGSMRYVTHRPDGRPLTKKTRAFIQKWMADNVPS